MTTNVILKANTHKKTSLNMLHFHAFSFKKLHDVDIYKNMMFWITFNFNYFRRKLPLSADE